MDVFWRHGFAATSMSQLLSRMGIGKKSLYDTFGNKRELFLRALDLYAEKSRAHTKEVLAQPGSVMENLRQLFEGFQREDCRGCFFGNNMADFDLSDPEVSKRFCSHLKGFETCLREALEAGHSRGEIREEVDPAEAAHLLSCLGQGTALVGRIRTCPQRQQNALNLALALLSG